jgi:hypothetical protein
MKEVDLRRSMGVGVSISVVTVLGLVIATGCGHPPKPGPGAAAGSACDVPTARAGSTEELAWRLFVAASCKTKSGQLTWETWKTQACLNNPDDCGGAKRLRGSILTAAKRGTLSPDDPKRTGGCSPMTTAETADPSLKPFVPSNLSASPVFCEEVTINPAEEKYASGNGLLTVAGQNTFLQSGKTIQFPTDAIEVKADWVPAASFQGVTFDCSQPSTTVYQEMIDGTCYALAGIHISSKLYPNWLWATFEPQDPRTNPNRCKPDLYNACTDPWGSSPATSTGAATQPTAALAALFRGAGAALDPSFQNYRLTGVQTEFPDPASSNGVLGSSFVEFNANVAAGQASCITCHNSAQRDPSTGKTLTGGFPYDNQVGPPGPPPGAQWKPLDFSWFLGFGVPQ